MQMDRRTFLSQLTGIATGALLGYSGLLSGTEESFASDGLVKTARCSLPKRKNVIVFCVDQQRADSLGCMGNLLARTPNLDRLADRGILYTQHYTTNPVCMPSRASFITGRYPQAHRVLTNGIHLPDAELTIPEVFRQQGYRTASFGKMHFQTQKSYKGDISMESAARWNSGELDSWTGPYYGFEKVAVTTGHGEGCGGAYGRWRRRNFLNLKLGAKNAQGGRKFPRFASYKSNLPLEAHHSTWVAARAMEFLDSVDEKPFYLQVSFPDPHHPFTPPTPYHSMFDDVHFPSPHAVEGENDYKPKPYREAMTGNPFRRDGYARYHPDFTGAAYQQVVGHTYGMVSLIDDCVGRILERLEQSGMMENTIIVFTSDHGDFLGDHFFLHKGQAPCRSLLNIPLIIADPDQKPGVVDTVSSNVDVMPSLLAACGIDIPDSVQGVVLPKPGETPKRDYAYEAGWGKLRPEWNHHTLYKQDWRITVYPRLCDGELYNLQEDPFEHRNLFHNSKYQAKRLELTEELLLAMGEAEVSRPNIVTDW